MSVKEYRPVHVYYKDADVAMYTTGNAENSRYRVDEDICPGTSTTLPERDKPVIYGVDDVPPWYLCILLGFQHYLTAFGSTLSVPLVLYTSFCMDQDTVGLSELISTVFFVSGLSTIIQTAFGISFILGFQHCLTAINGQITIPLFIAPVLCMDTDLVALSELISTCTFIAGLISVLQTTLGVRLPIIQGATFAFLTPTFAILGLKKWECPYTIERQTDPLLENSTLPEPGSLGHRLIWQARIREIQGAIMVASLFQILIGFTGMIGFILKFIGPLAITPTVTLIGLSLFSAAAAKASEQWYIAVMTMFLIALFSQYLRGVMIPCCVMEKGKGIRTTRMPIFSLFPVLLAMIVSWIVCLILTVTNVLSDKKGEWGYNARTDIKSDVLEQSDWFRFPYPGQWGIPTVSTAGVFGMLAGVLSSMIESIGDYYACARLSGAPPPPVHAINRGIWIEGIGCILAGAWGSGNGTTSYSENVGAIGITKVGSRRVVQVGGFIMLLLGCLGKFGALFVTIPDPVVGGVFMVMFGMITAVGLSNLQYVNLNSSRNIFILGVSLLFGLSFPGWISSHGDAVNTGSTIADQIITVLLGTSMFVGGMTGFILDNTIPGTDEERGILKWRRQESSEDGNSVYSTDMRTYELPLIQKYLDKIAVFRYLPICPSFGKSRSRNENDVERNVKSNEDCRSEITNTTVDTNTKL